MELGDYRAKAAEIKAAIEDATDAEAEGHLAELGDLRRGRDRVAEWAAGGAYLPLTMLVQDSGTADPTDQLRHVAERLNLRLTVHRDRVEVEGRLVGEFNLPVDNPPSSC